MSQESLKKRLRQFLNPARKGKFTEAMLNALAKGDEFNEFNILAVKEQSMIATASGPFLESLIAAIGINKPSGVGISDDLFREISIKQTSSKLVTNIFLDVLEVFYGEDAIRANVRSGRPQGYLLTNGMTLSIKVDRNPTPLLVTFETSDFTNIANATAVEVANVISRSAFNSGYSLTANAEEEATTGLIYVRLLSGTKGPNSSITVLGGAAQNILRFPAEKQATTKVGTEFTMSFSGPFVRFTWTAGASPELAFVNPGDYVNIFGSGFLESNQGTFTIENVQDGPVSSAFFEIINPNFISQSPVTLAQVNGASGSGTVTKTVSLSPSPTGAVRSAGNVTITTVGNHNLSIGQTVSVLGVDDSSFNGTFTITGTSPNTFTYVQNTSNDMVFFNPERQIIQKMARYASVYEASPYEITVFLPATTKIVKRTLRGGWHLHNSQTDKNFVSAYIFDTTTGFPVTKTGTQLTESIFAGELKTVAFGTNTADFPDSEGFIVLDWGTSNQEGPVRYLGRPSSGSILLDPSYKFQKTHAAGSDMRLLKDRKPYKPRVDGGDLATYVTGTIKGRVEAERLIDSLKAAGIFLNVIIVYPKGPGLHDVENYVYAGDFV